MSLARLRVLMLGFFLALAVPAVVLVGHAYGQLKWEAFYQYRQLADEVSRRIDGRIARVLAAEEARGFADYQFLIAANGGAENIVQRSPLSAFPVQSDIPGLIGWFQVDMNGVFSSPLLPPPNVLPRSVGLSEAERVRRALLLSRMQGILGANRLVVTRQTRAPPALRDELAVAPAASVAGSAATPLAALERGPLRPPPAGGGAGTSQGAGITARHDVPPAVKLAERSRLAVESEASAAPAPDPSAQAAFDALSQANRAGARRKQASAASLGRVDDLRLAQPYADRQAQASASAPAPAPDKARTARSAQRKDEAAPAVFPAAPAPDAVVAAREERVSTRAPEAKGDADKEAADSAQRRILTFENELDAFEFSLLDSGHFVLYRKVWRGGQRYIQGALIDQQAFLSGLAESAFTATALSRVSNLVVAWQGDVFAAFSGDAYRPLLARADELKGALLYRSRLSAPLADLELVFSVTSLPAGPGAGVIAWTAAALAAVLVVGMGLIYRLGARQLALAAQQQDFVSAVSHELRTPITSIRMYAEMLQEGWASEEKKRGYYAFIVQESERLSRLVANVLQLARMSRKDFVVQTGRTALAELIEAVHGTISSQVEHAGFELRVHLAEPAAGALLDVDADAFSQCVINLVDNALKFSAAAETKVVEITCAIDDDKRVCVRVRDYGPGVARDQMQKIFALFYRAGDELTRETVGTGIGLALVHQLMRAMHGDVVVADAAPGARFELRFPRVDD